MTNHHGRTAVYRLYDANGTLLYIGSSSNPKYRYSEHSRSPLKPWWPEVARREETWYDNRSDAQKAEAMAIKTEQPLHNIRLTIWSKRDVWTVKLSEAKAAAADKARGGMTKSRWLESLIDTAIAAAADGYEPPVSLWQQEPPPKHPESASRGRRETPCTARLPSGAFCKTCGQVHK